MVRIKGTRTNRLLVAALASVAVATVSCVWGGEPVPPEASAPAPVQVDGDPFAELLKNHPSQAVKIGPSCQFIKVQLPPGVRPEDIPGFGTP